MKAVITELAFTSLDGACESWHFRKGELWTALPYEMVIGGLKSLSLSF